MTLLFIIIGIQPLGRSGQRPELSQATGMALVRCIRGKFLGVACHCFPRTDDIPHYYFLNLLELVLITILKLSYTKIVTFNSSSKLLHFYSLFTLPSRHKFLVYFDVKDAMSSLKIFSFCTWTFL